jgi:hypothetical protein
MPVGPDEAYRHLGKALRSARRWCDELIVYGDGAEAATLALIATYATHWDAGDESLYETSEHLVRNKLLDMADATLDEGDLVVALDADEEILGEPGWVRDRMQTLATIEAQSFNVHFLHLWNPEGTMHRTDGMWQPSVGPRIYRHKPGYRIQPLAESAWVCPPLPAGIMAGFGPPMFDVLHWSYANPEDRAPKHKRYTEKLGHNPQHIASILTEPVLEPVSEYRED